jgi:hypothetical protein
MKTFVPRVPDTINYIFFTTVVAALQWKVTVPAARNKALFQWLPVRLV